MKNKESKLLIAVMAMLFLLAGCGKQQDGSDNSVARISIKGSDTMVHLVSNWAEAYMNNNPSVEISVTGGGSGTGISAMLNKTTDIAASSRSIKKKEINLASERGIEPVKFRVAKDGIAVVINPNNPVNALTLEQLKKIFTGEYTNWNYVGGPDKDIILLSRESSSGTFVFFQEFVLRKQDYSNSALLMPSTSAIIQSTSDDAWAIGYSGLGYALNAADRVKIVAVKLAANEEGIMPSLETVVSGKYPISRPLHFFTNGKPSNAMQGFIDFCFGKEGQKIVIETGYVPISK